MFTKRILRILLIAAIALLTFNISPSAAEKLSLQPLPEATALIDMGSAFTYQGRLMDGSIPADGQYDFEFRLYDDPTAGYQVSATVSLANQSVSNGLFTVDVDFGMDAFDGAERWLEISVRPYSIDSEPYSTLLPRQQINPVPYATFARTIYRKTVVVKPVGSSFENGVALLNALANISDAAEENNYVLKIEPGTFDIGNNSLEMKEYVSLEGSGKTSTIISSRAFSTTDEATVIGSNYAELRSLTIRSQAYGSGNYATALLVNNCSQVLANVGLEAINGAFASHGLLTINNAYVILDSVSINVLSYQGDSYVILNDSSHIDLKGSEIDVEAFPVSYGVYIDNSSTMEMTGSQVYASDAMNDTIETTAVVINANSIVKIRNSQLRAQKNTPIGSASGVRISTSSLYLYDSFLDVIAGDYFNAGVYASSGYLEMNGTEIKAYGGDEYNVGIRDLGALLNIRESNIQAFGGVYAIGLWSVNNHSFAQNIIQTEISGTAAVPSGYANPFSNANFATILSGNCTYFFTRDTLRTEMEKVYTPAIEGGVGLLNDHASVVLENSTINSIEALAYIGVAHIFDGANILRVNNSEVYTCDDTACKSVYLESITPGIDPIFIGSTLIWGGPVDPAAICAFVYDEKYIQYLGPACP